jgi:hypothetical protein
MSYQLPSERADAKDREMELFQAQLAAKRAGRWDECRRLTAEWAREQQRLRQLS